MRLRKRKHCWHSTEFAQTDSTFSDTCCRCGLTARRHWEDVAEAVRGHGPWITTHRPRQVRECDSDVCEPKART